MVKVNKNSFKDNIGKISIDSFRINIPIELVEIIDSNLTDEWVNTVANSRTGEVITEKELKQNSFTRVVKDSKFRFILDNSFGNTHVVVLINSKQLCSNYFDGITLDNIREIYNNLIACEVIKLPFDMFIIQSIADVDFKKDNIINLVDYHKSLNIIKDCGKLSKYKDDGCLSYANGLEFSKRETSKYLSKPFFKIYHKEIELNQNSAGFSNKHLKGIDYKDGVRIECTVKNKKHFQSLGVEDNSLKTVLSLSNEVKESLISNIVKKHLSKREMIKPKKNIGLNPSQQILFDYVNLLLEHGNTIDGAITYILGPFSGNSKHRKKKELEYVYESFIMGTIAEKRSIKMNSFFDSFGWNSEL